MFKQIVGLTFYFLLWLVSCYEFGLDDVDDWVKLCRVSFVGVDCCDFVVIYIHTVLFLSFFAEDFLL